MKRHLAWLLLLLLPSVTAHAEPYESEPAGGSRLDDMPDAVRVAFTEPVFDDGSWIRVLDAEGIRVDNDDLTIVGEQRPVMRVTLPSDLPDGAYRIAWQTYSVTDGHTIRGSIGFAVGGFTPPQDEVQQEAGFDPLPSLARAVLYAGFSLGIGALAFAWVTRTDAHPRLLQAGAGAALAGTLLLTWDTWQGTGLDAGRYFSSDGGAKMLMRIYVLAGLTILTSLRTIIGSRLATGRAILAMGWLFAAFQSAQWGHVTQQGPWGVWIEWIHLVAAATWIGGLLALYVHLRHDDADWFQTGRRFGGLAATCVVLVAITGTTLTAALLWDAATQDASMIWSDSWTWFLAVKLAAVIVMLAAAAANRYGYLARTPPDWLRARLPTNGRDGFRRVVRWESTTAVVALAAAGLLLSVSPPQPFEAETPALERTAQGDTFTALMQVEPRPAVGTSHAFRFFINDPQADEAVTNNTCGRDDCIKARWSIDDDPGTEQEATAIPEGDGWWLVEPVLFTQAGNVTVRLDVQTGYVYLDSLEFGAFLVG